MVCRVYVSPQLKHAVKINETVTFGEGGEEDIRFDDDHSDDDDDDDEDDDVRVRMVNHMHSHFAIFRAVLPIIM